MLVVSWKIVGVALLLAALVAAPPLATDARAAEPVPGCPDVLLSVEKDLARRKPNEAPYPVCIDAAKVLAAAQERARAENKLVLIKFGAPWCPVCRVLERELAAWRKGPDAARDALSGYVEISLSQSVIVAGKRHDIVEVQGILSDLSKRGDVRPLHAVPYLVAITPDGSRAVGRNLDELVPAMYERIDRDALIRSLTDMERHLREGAPAPVAPSWIVRKLRHYGLWH